MMKQFNKFACCFALVLVAILSPRTTFAAIQTYTILSSFTDSLQAGSYLENFNSVPNEGQTIFTGGTPTFTYVISSPSDVSAVDVIGGSRAISTFDPPNGLLVITFGAYKPTAIGGNFFWTDYPGNVIAGSIQVQYTGGDSGSIDVPLPSGSSFAGISTDNPEGFSSISVSLINYIPDTDFFVTLDNFHVGNVNPVPEPGTWIACGFIGLFVVGRAGCGILRRRFVRQ